MTTYVIANDFQTTLASALTSTATSATVSSTTNLPTLAAGEIMPLILNDAATRSVYEICYVTAISGSTLTIERGQEGTSAVAWAIGDYAYCSTTGRTIAVATGNPNNTFQVADAVNPSDAVNLGQFSGLYVPTGVDGANIIDITSSTTLTAAQSGHIIDPWTANSAFTLTLPTISKGLNYMVLPSQYTVTINGGGANIRLADNSTSTTFTFNPSTQNQLFIQASADGAEWLLRQTGETIVSDPQYLNDAVSLHYAQNYFAAIGGSASNVFQVGNGTYLHDAVNMGQFVSSGFGGSALYFKLPSLGSPNQSVVIQTGFAGASSTPTTITFPIAFPNALVSVFATVNSVGITTANEGPIYYSASTTQVTIDPSGVSSKPHFCWVAIGY